MTMRRLYLTGVAACGLALLTAVPASARTICDEYGSCYNTSGRPIYQPHYGYGNGYGYGYGYGPRPYWWGHHHHHRFYDERY